MEPVSTMDTILGAIANLVSLMTGLIADFVDVITQNPLILLFVIVAFVGLGIGLLSRLMHL